MNSESMDALKVYSSENKPDARRKANDRDRRLLSWFIRSDYFEWWEHDNLGNQLFLTDPERADRLNEAAEDGCDGSTHHEHIQDWRDAVETWRQDRGRRGGMKGDCYRVADAIGRAIDEVEEYHDGSGALFTVVG